MADSDDPNTNNSNQPTIPATFTQDLVMTTCAVCGIVFACPKSYDLARRNDCRPFKCPNDHALVYYLKEKTRDQLKPENKDLTDLVSELKIKNITLQAQLDQLQAKLSDQKNS